MKLTRRRFLVAAAAATILGPASRQHWEWRGSVMGAEARIVLTGPRDQAELALADVVAEIDRLENIFSLNRAHSQLARLNASGEITAPAQDLRSLLAAADHWKRLTAGSFDLAVQPLWAHYAQGAERPDEATLERVRQASVQVSSTGITLSAGAALTLNGIAQGTVGDRVAELLTRRGFTPPLIDTGEMLLPGPTRRDIALPEANLNFRLAEVAIATSAPGALIFDPAGARTHIFDPMSGETPGWWRSVTVFAPRAETADALSTAFAVAAPEVVGDLTGSLDGVAVIATTRSGEVRIFGNAALLQGGARA